MIVVGLTGGIGSGKSTVASMLQEMGARIIDADRIARDVVRPGEPALASLRAEFGEEVVTEQGELDRAAVAARVFDDPDALKRLNAIVHPAVAARTAEEIEDARQAGARWVVYDVPLLYENDLEHMFDKVIVVASSESVRRQRLREREQWSTSDIDARMAMQMPLEEKVQRADFVVDNDGSLVETRRQVEEVTAQLFEATP
jgi:dephospho-CoA kinase